MRIAIFTDTYPPQINGVATATYTLAQILMSHKDDVLVVTTSIDGQKSMTYDNGIIRIPGFTAKKLYNYKFSGIYNSHVYKMLKKFNPEVIHVQTEVGIGIFGRIAAHKLHIPLVYTYHTMYEDYTYYVTKGFRPFDIFAKKVVASASAMVGDRTTEFITTSHKTKEALRRYGVEKYINVVPNGVNLSNFDPKIIDSTKVAEIRKKYGFEGKYVIMILGRLAKEKANDLVVKWLHAYLDANNDPDIRLLIVGEGPDRSNLEKIICDLGMKDIVSFTGRVSHDEVPIYYNLADVYISASTSETQGLTYNEAMASHTLVMARYDENLVDAIKDGETGFFFEDKKSFLKTMHYVRNIDPEEKKTIIENAYNADVQLYSLELFYERVSDVYKKAIRKYW
jgi:1,2-diacylglycerol 3-alpha-glucosyltransferase